ncbi:MAG: uroporphyrinogen decarboxylase [Oscillospiraceae bacterium]|jgi:hypothetical protein|nr:uroporphyrinogen decarboxylase [Oscillospiraceae bacterium]
MLTAKENMREVVRGGKPDRFVNQYEAVYLMFHPYFMFTEGILLHKGDTNVINPWGVTMSFPENVPGQFPVHTPDKIVIKDITKWRDYVKGPPLEFTDEQWAAAKAMYDEVDGTKAYKASFIVPGLFDQTHYLCEIINALMYFIEYPDEMHAMIDYLTEWELKLAEGICKHLKPDALFHHDDWGSESSTFMSPGMFEDFFLEPYKRTYSYYKENGVELVIHHADSYQATLVPAMIEMGIDVWQGCMESNNVAELVKKYGNKMTFMGGIDNKSVDFTGWTQEHVRNKVREVCDACGVNYFIPCITQGGPGSLFEGTYDALINEIDKYNEEKFGLKGIADQRLPLQILF